MNGKVVFSTAIVCASWLMASNATLAAPSNRDCAHRNNGTSARLLECIRAPALWRHLQNFQKIADENPGARGHGNRDVGTSGYRASVDYVAHLMRGAGYRVTIQPYQWRQFKLLETPLFRAGAGSGEAGKDWFVARLSGSGAVTAPVQALGTDDTESSTQRGCAPADFKGFTRGRIALALRGSCDFDRQVANAELAGAAALIVYNSARVANGTGRKRHDDGAAYQAQLSESASIPVVAVISHELGAELAARYRAGKGPQASIAVHAKAKSDTDYNVIADSLFGDNERVVVVDAHLDSIYGAGILDNASGSTTILELALKMAHTPTHNQLRYIWFGGEEIGLLGSRYYTRALSEAENRAIVFDIDVDVTATPNYSILVADPGHAHNVGEFPRHVVHDSKVGNELFVDYFRSIGIPARLAKFGNDGTDSIQFSLVGVPNSGILTQQNCCKKTWEVDLWGGFPGNYEGKIPGRNGGCVDYPGRWCDNLSNNDRLVLTVVSKAVADVTLKLANDASLHRR